MSSKRQKASQLMIWRDGTFQARVYHGLEWRHELVSARICGLLAVHPSLSYAGLDATLECSAHRWTVSHVLTGLAVDTSIGSRRAAMRLAKALLAATDWTFATQRGAKYKQAAKVVPPLVRAFREQKGVRA